MNFTFSTFIITYMTIFIFGCFFGYCLEVIFRRFFTARKWVNPGFLQGPWLPLYGSGLVLMFSLTMLFANVFAKDIPIFNPYGNIFGRTLRSGPSGYDLLIILGMWISLVLLEFIAGLIFVKGFKIRLWDYTNMRGNILGVICPLFNFFWLLIAIAYYYLFSPTIYVIIEETSKYMFGTSDGAHAANFGLIVIIGIIYGIFIVDLIKSLNIFHYVRKFVKDSGIMDNYEKVREQQKRLRLLAKTKLEESIPDALKINKHKKKIKKDNKFVTFIKRIIFIDPNKADTGNNYDENGRPISEK